MVENAPSPLKADAVVQRLRSEFATVVDRPTLSGLLNTLFNGALGDLLNRLNPGLTRETPLPPGKVGLEVPLNKAMFTQLVTAAAVQSGSGVEVWTKDDSELIVATGKVTADLSDGLVVVNIPVWCDQTTDATIQVPFAVGGATTPSGLLVATEEHPRGPDAIIAVWSEPLLAYAWKILLTVATRTAVSTGTDTDGAGLVPAALTATPDGIRLLTMARHTFDRVAG